MGPYETHACSDTENENCRGILPNSERSYRRGSAYLSLFGFCNAPILPIAWAFVVVYVKYGGFAEPDNQLKIEIAGD